MNAITGKNTHSAYATAVAGIAIAAFQSLLQAQQQGNSCPLTPSQEVAAVRAFKRLAPIFREPRCLNCHGAVNPFVEDGGHPEHIDIREEARDFLRRPDLQDFLSRTPFDQETKAKDLRRIREVSEKRQPIIDNDFIRPNAQFPMEEACERCHMEEWIIPFREHQFIQKSDEALCVQMKTSEHTRPAKQFLQHMRADKLVLAGFKGTRGLVLPPNPLPPAMPFSTFQRHVNDWVAAMDGRFHEPPDCGCKIHGLVLQIQHRIDTDPTDIFFKGGETKFAGAVDFVVRLEPRPDIPEGWLTGKASTVRPISVHHVRRDCSGKSAPRREDWDFRLIPDESGTSMKFMIFIHHDTPAMTLTCRGGPQEGIAQIFSELSGRRDMRIQGTTGATRRFESKAFQSREWLTVTVLNGSEKK